jgi:O-antigen ligase
MDPTLHSGFVIWSFLSLVLGVWLFAGNIRHQEVLFVSMAHRRIFWAGGAFILTAAFSLTRSINMGEGVFAWLGIFLAGSFLYMCSLLFCRYPHFLLILSHWAVAAGVGLVIFGSVDRYLYNGSASLEPFFLKGIMVNKNLYASSLFLFIPFVVHCLVSGKKAWRWIAAILLPILCLVLLVSMSKAVWLAMIFASVPIIILVFLFPFNCCKKEKSVKKSVKRAAFLAIPIAALVWVCLFWPQSLNKTGSIQLRLHLWNSTVQMIRDELFFGVGLGQWRIVLPKYGDALAINDNSGDNIEIRAQRPHNDFLWVAAETGVLGVTCYLLFFGILYYYAVKIINKADDEQKVLTLSILYGMSGYLIIAMFSYPRERPLHSLLIMIMAAAVVSSYHRLYPATTRGSGVIVPIFKYAMLILLVVCCLDSGLRLYSEIQLKKAFQAREHGEWHQVIGHIDKAFLSVYSIDPFGVPLLWYRGMAHYNLKNLPTALDDFIRAVNYHPYHTLSLNNLAIMQRIIRNQNQYDPVKNDPQQPSPR